MNWGKVAVIALVGSAIGAGFGVWYAQNYAYYYELDPASVALTAVVDGAPVALAASDIRGIDADSAPHRWRVCATLGDPVPAVAQPYEGAAPTIAPHWFDCFDADQIGADVSSGAATALLAQSEIHPDIDRVLAVYPDGRVFGWHQINDKTPARGVMD